MMIRPRMASKTRRQTRRWLRVCGCMQFPPSRGAVVERKRREKQTIIRKWSYALRAGLSGGPRRCSVPRAADKRFILVNAITTARVPIMKLTHKSGCAVALCCIPSPRTASSATWGSRTCWSALPLAALGSRIAGPVQHCAPAALHPGATQRAGCIDKPNRSIRAWPRSASD